MTSNTLEIKDAIEEANIEGPSIYEEISLMDSQKYHTQELSKVLDVLNDKDL